MPRPARRWMPPRDRELLVVLLSVICSLALVAALILSTWGYFFLRDQSTRIQQQRLDGARGQCAIVGAIATIIDGINAQQPGSIQFFRALDIDTCVNRICAVVADLGQKCDHEREVSRARRP